MIPRRAHFAFGRLFAVRSPIMRNSFMSLIALSIALTAAPKSKADDKQAPLPDAKLYVAVAEIVVPNGTKITVPENQAVDTVADLEFSAGTQKPPARLTT